MYMYIYVYLHEERERAREGRDREGRISSKVRVPYPASSMRCFLNTPRASSTHQLLLSHISRLPGHTEGP